MRDLTCAAVRRQLDAFLDDELQVTDRIAVSAHLDWCADCAAIREDADVIGAALRMATRSIEPIVSDDDGRLLRAVVNRTMAERRRSIVARLQELFQDWRPVLVGGAALTMAVVCVLLTVAMVQLGTEENPESLAAMIDRLASPGSNDNPLKAGGRVPMPRALDTSFATPGERDAVFALSAVVTREGRIEDLRLLRACVAERSEEARLSESLLDAVAQARFEPATLDGSPVAVRMVWLVASTTVHGDAEFDSMSAQRRRERPSTARLLAPA